MGDTSLSESPEEEDDNDSPDPDRGGGSPQNTSLSPSLDNRLGSPRKRTQTLPAFNCPLTGMAAKTDAINRWSRLQETVEEKTLSEDIFKILDLRSPGSLFGWPQTTTKQDEEKLTTQGGSDATASSDAGPQKPNSDSQRSAGQPTASASTEQVNNRPERPERKKDSPQLLDR